MVGGRKLGRNNEAGRGWRRGRLVLLLCLAMAVLAGYTQRRGKGTDEYGAYECSASMPATRSATCPILSAHVRHYRCGEAENTI